MSLKFKVPQIDFMRLAPAMGTISVVTFIIALGFIFFKGFHYGIDFSGGTEMQVKFAAPPDANKIRQTLAKAGVPDALVQTIGTENEILIRMQQPRGKDNAETNKLNQERVGVVTKALQAEDGLPEDGVQRVDTVGPQVGAELQSQALLSVLYSLLVILIYVGLRFDFRYAPGAVICLFHDTVVVLGIYSLIGREINVQVLAGVLTLIGYSINDTIVVFDCVRGNEATYKQKGLYFVINHSINDMMVRTILMGTTTMIASVCLFVFGVGAIHDIALTMIIGIILGTYSSIYVAAPLIPITDKLMKRLKLI
jgi:preprotein translocase subunit SecF